MASNPKSIYLSIYLCIYPTLSLLSPTKMFLPWVNINCTLMSLSLWRAQSIKWHCLPVVLGMMWSWEWRAGMMDSIYGWDSKGIGLFCVWWQVPVSGWDRQGRGEARFQLLAVWKQDVSLSVPIPWGRPKNQIGTRRSSLGPSQISPTHNDDI